MLTHSQIIVSPGERRSLRIKQSLIRAALAMYPYLPDSMIRTISKKIFDFKNFGPAEQLMQKSMITAKLMLRNASPTIKRKLVENFFMNEGFWGDSIRLKMEHVLEGPMPCVIVISPTMRCNLRCTGCYSAQYSQSEDLDFDVLDRLITEANSMGIYFFVLTGGEPFIYPRL